jgi:hypothetical protein
MVPALLAVTMEEPMRRFWILLVVAGMLGLGVTSPAEAKRKAKKAKAAPMSEGISKEMGELKWGTPLKKVVGYFSDRVKAKYRKQIAQATSAGKEDKLRHKMRNEIAKIRDSVVRFEGSTTGWDVSFLQGEFTHGNGEALFVVRDGNSQNFYFFMNGRLWKWYKAFDADVFQGAGFDQFAGAIQGRYGKAVTRKGEATPGAGERTWLEWQDKATRLRAIDQTHFYGFYCLVFDEKNTVRRLAELRRVKKRKDKGDHAMVEHVTGAGDEESGADAHQDVVDRITGKIRNRKDAPKGSSNPRSSSGGRGGGGGGRGDLSDL